MLEPSEWKRLRRSTRKDTDGRSLSLRDVAERVDLSFQRIGQFEIGDGAPDTMQAHSLLKLYAANGSKEAQEILSAGLPNERGSNRPSVILTPRVADVIKAAAALLYGLDVRNVLLPEDVRRRKIAVANAMKSCMDAMSDEDKKNLEGWL